MQRTTACDYCDHMIRARSFWETSRCYLGLGIFPPTCPERRDTRIAAKEDEDADD